MTLRHGAHGTIHLIVAFALLALLLAGCDVASPPSSRSTMASDQTLKLLWLPGGTDISTLDPAQCSDTGCGPIINLLFDGLVTLDKQLHVEAWGASSWTVSADGRTYTFTLRPGQRFSDGIPVKPSDYAWSIERSLSPCIGSPTSYYLIAIKDAATFNGEKCDTGAVGGSRKTLIGDSILPDDSDNTLSLTLEQPTGYFLEALSYVTSYALEQRIVTGPNLGRDGLWMDTLSQGASGQGGSGMFYVARWDHHAHLILKPNPYWWGASAGRKLHFTAIDFSLFGDPTASYATYQTDRSFAYSGDIPPAQMADARTDTDFHTVPTLTVSGLEFNWKIAPFDEVSARRAFCEAINRDALNASIHKGTLVPTWHIVPQGMPGYNQNAHGIDNSPTAGNLDAATANWATYRAAHPGAHPTVTISFDLEFNTAELTAEALQATWRQLFGLDIQIDQRPWKEIFAEMTQKRLQVFPFAWVADYPDPEDFLTLLFASDSANNFNYASVASADQLMRQADGLRDLGQRLPLYAQAEQLLIDQVAFCPLFQATTYYRLRTWVKGDFVQDAQGTFPNDAWVSGYIAKH